MFMPEIGWRKRMRGSLAAGASVAARVDRSSFARRPQLLDRVNVAWLRNAATQRTAMVSDS